MLWTQTDIQTLREDTHAPLVRAGYKRAGQSSVSDWLLLGRRSLQKIERIVATAQNFGIALGKCGIRFIRTSTSYVMESPAGDQIVVRGNEYDELLDEAASIASPLLAPDPEGDFAPEPFHTPNVKTIAQIAEFTGLPVTSQMKSLVMIADGAPVLVLLRGDHQLSEKKFQAFTGASIIRQATADELRTTFGADPGSLGPVGVAGVRIVADSALSGRRNMICGANRNDYHLRQVTPNKDFTAGFADLRLVNEGDACVHGGPLVFSKVRVLSPEDPGVILESAAEQHHDSDGLTLPRAIAPFEVVVTPVHPERMEAAREIYQRFSDQSHDILLDDRDARPGVKFKDADLIGFPFRINIGKKLGEGLVELVARNPKQSSDVPVAELRIPS
ncbi:MAG: YbaK/EbsC family protein [Bryobacteraceae bacterium]